MRPERWWSVIFTMGLFMALSPRTPRPDLIVRLLHSPIVKLPLAPGACLGPAGESSGFPRAPAACPTNPGIVSRVTGPSPPALLTDGMPKVMAANPVQWQHGSNTRQCLRTEWPKPSVAATPGNAYGWNAHTVSGSNQHTMSTDGMIIGTIGTSTECLRRNDHQRQWDHTMPTDRMIIRVNGTNTRNTSGRMIISVSGNNLALHSPKGIA